MNAAINPDVLGNATTVNPLDLPGLEQVFHHPTFIKVVNELKAPKSHTNEFGGGYKYRSAEDIQEALKPLLVKYKCTVITRKFDTADGLKFMHTWYSKTRNIFVVMFLVKLNMILIVT